MSDLTNNENMEKNFFVKEPKIEEQTDESNLHECYMRIALDVAKSALEVGEVPVGCVIVLRDTTANHPNVSNMKQDEGENDTCPSKWTDFQEIVRNTTTNSHAETTCRCSYMEHSSVIISHGANMVNATRDATRHAEMVAIDRMLTGAVASDQLCLPNNIMASYAMFNDTDNSQQKCIDVHDKITKKESLLSSHHFHCSTKPPWKNVKDSKTHWKNQFGWKSNWNDNQSSTSYYHTDIFPKCDLYVTCEPCIMCAAALAQINIGRVFFGCKNDRFGGCGSLMNLHLPLNLTAATSNNSSVVDPKSLKLPKGYPIKGGILEKEAIILLRSFYNRENIHAPEDKRKRK